MIFGSSGTLRVGSSSSPRQGEGSPQRGGRGAQWQLQAGGATTAEMQRWDHCVGFQSRSYRRASIVFFWEWHSTTQTLTTHTHNHPYEYTYANPTPMSTSEGLSTSKSGDSRSHQWRGGGLRWWRDRINVQRGSSAGRIRMRSIRPKKIS
jgi:hypothetical protein